MEAPFVTSSHRYYYANFVSNVGRIGCLMLSCHEMHIVHKHTLLKQVDFKTVMFCCCFDFAYFSWWRTLACLYQSLGLSITYEGWTKKSLTDALISQGSIILTTEKPSTPTPLEAEGNIALALMRRAPSSTNLSLCEGLLAGLGLLLLLESAHHEFICIEPFVDSCMDACSLLPTETIARPACDALLESFVGQIVNHGLYHHLLSHLQCKLLHFVASNAEACRATGH